MSDLTLASLFAGIGGFDLAAHRAGIRPVAAVEIDKQAAGVLRHHFPDMTVFDDVRNVTGDDLRRAGFVPERGILTGGFPCQPFSVAGRRRGMGGGDDRGELYWEISRLMAELAPRWVVLENVPGLLSIDGGRTFGTILGDLGRLGYGFAYRVLDAQHFGVAQRRRRVFVVGCLGDPARAASVLLEPEGSGGHPAPRVTQGTGTPGSTAVRTLTTRAGELDEQGVANLVTVSTLQGGGRSRTARGRRERSGWAPRGDVVNALTSATGGPDDNDAQAGHLVYVKAARSGAPAADGSLPPETWVEGGVSPTMNTFDNGDVRATVLAVSLRGRDGGAVPEIHGDGSTTGALRSASGGSSRDYVSITGTRTHALTAEGHDASEDGTGRGTPIVVQPLAFAWQAGGNNDASGAFNTDVTPTLPKSQTIAVQETATGGVRRLTPVECERLQGFPDHWTALRDTDTPQADSSRYRQLGNAVAVPVVEWILTRLVEADQ